MKLEVGNYIRMYGLTLEQIENCIVVAHKQGIKSFVHRYVSERQVDRVMFVDEDLELDGWLLWNVADSYPEAKELTYDEWLSMDTGE